MKQESPTFVKISLAAAMTLGFHPGRFWRDAKMTCVNLLLHYEDGCRANCAYCGLSRSRMAFEKTFIRVPWHVHATDDIIARLKKSKTARRTCISMITHRRASDDTLTLAGRLVQETPQPVSVLISPSITEETFMR
jgi:biotin synthase